MSLFSRSSVKYSAGFGSRVGVSVRGCSVTPSSGDVGKQRCAPEKNETSQPDSESSEINRRGSARGRINRHSFANKLAGMPSVSDLMRQYNVRASQKLSQNFLVDSNACRVLATATGSLTGAHVCEVGPGMGNITRHILAERPASLTVVERDARFMPGLLALRDYVDENLDVPMHIVAGDILRYNVDLAFGGGEQQCEGANQLLPGLPTRDWSEPVTDAAIVGNLPFNVAIPLLIRWLGDIAGRSSVWRRARVPMALTFQHEVGERMVAAPGDRENRCRLSVIVQAFCHVSYRRRLGGHLFVPRPNVDVAVMRLVPRVQPLLDTRRHSFARFERVVRAIFNTRAKHLWRAVGNLYPVAVRKQLASDTLRMAGLDCGATIGGDVWRLQQRHGFSTGAELGSAGAVRPFMCSTEEIARVCDAYGDICRLHPELENYDFRECNPTEREDAWRGNETLQEIVSD